MNDIFKRKCQCCGETFVTTNSIKVYKSGHQAKNNNRNQNAKRKKLHELNKPLERTYKIFDELLAEKKSISVTREFLRGRNVELTWLTHFDEFLGNEEPHIHDIMILDFDNFITLKRRKHA